MDLTGTSLVSKTKLGTLESGTTATAVVKTTLMIKKDEEGTPHQTSLSPA